EDLEDRQLMSVTAVLDFDGDTISAAEMQQGMWTGQGNKSFNGFKGLFIDSRPWLDLNLDGKVNSSDADLAISRILAKVKADYAPYDLNIIVGDQDDNQYRLTDAVKGDVLVMVTGGSDIVGADDGFGQSPWTDYFPNLGYPKGNQNDEIAFAFGGEYV